MLEPNTWILDCSKKWQKNRVLDARWWNYSQTWVNDPPLNNDRLPATTTILKFQLKTLQHKPTSEQRKPVNNGDKFVISRVTVVHWFDCTSFNLIKFSKSLPNYFQVIDFTTPIYTSDYRLYMRKPMKSFSWTTFADVFNLELWMVLVIICLVITFFIYFESKLLKVSIFFHLPTNTHYIKLRKCQNYW